MTDLDDRAGLVALLAWYRDMGVDAALADEAENWLERPDRPPGAGWSALPDPALPPALDEPRQGSAPVPGTPPRSVSPRPPSGLAAPVPARQPAAGSPQPRAPQSQPPDAAETAARTAARGAGTIGELGTALAAFNGCALKATAKNLCYYRGAPKARVMLIGEAPGREEDLAGKPFVGPAGQLLDKMLAAIGLDESSVHITNIVYWRPPGNRTPTPQEAQACRP